MSRGQYQTHQSFAPHSTHSSSWTSSPYWTVPDDAQNDWDSAWRSCCRCSSNTCRTCWSVASESSGINISGRPFTTTVYGWIICGRLVSCCYLSLDNTCRWAGANVGSRRVMAFFVLIKLGSVWVSGAQCWGAGWLGDMCTFFIFLFVDDKIRSRRVIPCFQ